VIDHVLIVGYGNALRTDDGLGWHAAALLADDPRLAGATIIRRQQLTPELALDISRAARVIFIDASNRAPGSVAIEPVAATPAAAAPAWSHHVDPAVLLALARDLYGASPEAFAVSAGAADLGLGEDLSDALAEVLPAVLDAVAGLALDGRSGAMAATGASRA
jgi:hydrogenase maturation protease